MGERFSVVEDLADDGKRLDALDVRWFLPEVVLGRESEGGSGFGVLLDGRPGGFGVLVVPLS